MSHECPECGRLCYCDLEDTYMPEAADDCLHTCEPEYDDDFEPADESAIPFQPVSSIHRGES